MAGRFNPNWDDVQPGFGALDKGDYAFIIGEVKPFSRAKQDGGISQGVGIPLRTEDGQKAYHQMYMTENTAGMVLGFLMCAYGFDPNDKSAVAEFKAQYGTKMGVDFDTMELGAAYTGLTGQRIRGTNEPRDFAGNLQNNFKWRPF